MGQSAFFPNCCNIRSLPPSSPMQCWTTRRQAFPYEQHYCMGEGGWGGVLGRIWPKERFFPCEKLIDGRGSVFCKLVPHNFGQDCRCPSEDMGNSCLNKRNVFNLMACSRKMRRLAIFLVFFTSAFVNCSLPRLSGGI